MSEELRARLAAVDADIAARQGAGDVVAEASLRQKRAFVLMGLADEAGALDELQRAEELLAEGPTRLRAQAAYGHGLLLERTRGKAPLAEQAFRRSAALAQEAGDPLQEMKALHRAVLLLSSQGRLEEARGLLQEMAERLRTLDNHHGLADVHRHLALLSMAVARHDRAMAELDQALEHARRHGDPQKCLQIRLERRALRPFSAPPAEGREDWQELIDEALALDERGTAGQAQLQRAAERLRRDDFRGGEESAQEARASALATDQHVLYLMACLLIAEARHSLGDRVGVLEILLTCRATLQRTLGEEAAYGPTLVLDSLKQRWGAEGLAEARRRYRERMRGAEA